MKVLFVYKYLTLGGCETVIRARLEGLEREGIEAHAWFFEDLGGIDIFAGLESRVRVGGLRDCESAILDEGFDLVSTIDTEEVFPLFEANPRLPALVVEAHSPHPENLEYLRRTEDVPVAAFFAPSEYQAALVAERVAGPAAITVVPNPLRASFCEAIAPTSGARPPRIAWIGRLDALKNWPEFVDVAASLRGSGIDAVFRLVGRAPDRLTPEALLARLEAAAVADRLRWYRGLDHARIPAFLDFVRDSGGVVVVTSRGESFGMVAAEAMARGCACVIADQPPLSELAGAGRFARTYPPGDAGRAAAEVASLLADADGRTSLGSRARDAILARHSPAAAIPALARALESAASRK
ncbi:MAG TPA: glycosyltransferase family 4 protein [Thermoanaerobaculia bacterium]|nr:glycosyltransferase family 4 protein [Thermoanaerobaculia bacterium]